MFPNKGDIDCAELPIAEARKLVNLRKRADHIETKERFHVEVGPIEGEEGDTFDDQDFDEYEPDVEEDEEEKEAETFEVVHEPSKPLDKEFPKEIKDALRLGGWFRRLPVVDPTTIKAPNEGSKRPINIHPHVRSGVGASPQQHELKCREAEAEGIGPPGVPPHIFDILPEEGRQKIAEAIMEAVEVAEKA